MVAADINAADMTSSGNPTVASSLPSSFKNPFDASTGAANAYEDRTTFAAPAATKSGISSYSDSATTQYNIKGHGKTAALTLVLTSGQ